MDRPTSKDSEACEEVFELCRFDDLEDGEVRGFDRFGEGRDTLFIVRRGESLNAYRNKCPHQGASLPWRENAYLNKDGTHIVCNAHGALFDIDSGKCVRGPALGRALDRVEIRVSDGGRILADGLSRRTNSSVCGRLLTCAFAQQLCIPL